MSRSHSGTRDELLPLPRFEDLANPAALWRTRIAALSIMIFSWRSTWPSVSSQPADLNYWRRWN